MHNTTLVKDPVWGMDVRTATAAVRSEHKGQTYHFCGSACKEKFDINPERYLNPSGVAPKTTHG